MQPPVQITGVDDRSRGRHARSAIAAATVFAQLRNGQPLPVRQLAR